MTLLAALLCACPKPDTAVADPESADVPRQVDAIVADDLVLPWTVAVDPDVAPSFSGGTRDDIARAFFVTLEAPIEVAVIGRYHLADGVSAYVYRTYYAAIGDHQWAVKYRAKDGWSELPIARYSVSAGTTAAWSATIEENGSIEIDAHEVTRDDAGNPTGLVRERVSWTFVDGAYAESSRTAY